MKLALPEDPSARFNRANRELAGVLASAAELRRRVPTDQDALEAHVDQVTSSVRAVIGELEQLLGDFRTVVEVLPEEVEVEIGSIVVPRHTSDTNPETSASSGTVASARVQGGRRRTAEQQKIVESEARVICVNAFAGTGKTHMLVEYAGERSRTTHLYMAFNRGIATSAKDRFGPNVRCKTSHSMAFAAVGKEFSHKLGNARAKEILELLQETSCVPGATPADEYVFAQAALSRVKDFFAEGELHADIRDEDTASSLQLPSGEVLDGRLVAAAARQVWAAMKDTANPLLLPHDGYLKLWQLSQPDLSRFDRILVDEAQDCNPALLSIVQAQRTGLLLVGDRRQGIYRFRGSIDAMSRMDGATRFALTHSFRFGPDVAGVANALLGVFCDEDMKVVGAGRFTLPGQPSHAALYRTNAGLFGRAVDWLDVHGVSVPGRGLHFVGGVPGYQFEAIADTWRLMKGELHAISDPFLRKFSTFDQLEHYADAVQDRELLARIGIVDTYSHRIPELVDRVKAAHVDLGPGVLELTSAHKSKGLEWDRVELGEDFPDLLAEDGSPRSRRFQGSNSGDRAVLDSEEVNLFYVAATRARCLLKPNAQLEEFLEWCKEHPSRVEPPKRGQVEIVW